MPKFYELDPQSQHIQESQSVKVDVPVVWMTEDRLYISMCRNETGRLISEGCFQIWLPGAKIACLILLATIDAYEKTHGYIGTLKNFFRQFGKSLYIKPKLSEPSSSSLGK